MAYPAGYWAELVRSSSGSSIVESTSGNTVWLRTSDGEPLEQQIWNTFASPPAWVDIPGDTEEPDRIENSGFRHRFRKPGEAWLPSDNGTSFGIAVGTVPWNGRTTYRLFEVPATSAPSFTDNTGDAQAWMTGVDIDAITVPAATALPAATYAAVGTLPAGIVFNANTRQITGRPTSPGSGTITIRATNSQGSADWTVAYTTSSVQGGLKIGNTLIDFDLVGDLKIGTELVGGMKIGTELIYQVGDTTPSAHHTYTIVAGGSSSVGYNGPSRTGSITDGTFTTPSNKAVSVTHTRNVGTELNFALTGTSLNARDFPTSIKVTKTTGGEVSLTLEPQSGSFRRLRSPANTWRQDYDPTNRGDITTVFVSGQTIRVELFY